ncbi:MAG: DegV family protein [Erysipelotrichaceae bacterium]|nr:DegV family protein [Erysipelotrichaceae bacterium]MDY5252852.1 DegV family protein [Erysipelotrichaceae bacterium]
MKNYKIISDCTCDLSDDIVKDLDVEIIPMEVLLDDKSFDHYLDYRNCAFKDFYRLLDAGSMASTTQINPAKYLDVFESYLKQGLDVLYVCFSSGLSSTYASSLLAANELNEKYDKQVYVVDSKCASGGEGLLLVAACKNQKDGMEIGANVEWLQANILKVAHWFTVNDLMFLKRGGRISSTAAIVGSALKIKPVLHVDDEGHLINVTKAHGRKASINALFAKMQQSFDDSYDLPIVITHGDCLEEAEYLKNKIQEAYPSQQVLISGIGPVIGAHSGPKTLALFFMAAKR